MNPFYKTPEEAVAAAIASGWVDTFEGDNCDEVRDEMGAVCYGWDGVSRRCDCGNRRVNWDKGGYWAGVVIEMWDGENWIPYIEKADWVAPAGTTRGKIE